VTEPHTPPLNEGKGPENERDPNPAKPPAPPGSTVGNNGRAHNLLNAQNVGDVYFNSQQTPKPEIDRPVDLPKLPPNVMPFRDPKHDQYLKTLETQRILILASYREKAAYAAAHGLVNDPAFQGKARRALFPTSRSDKERSDLDLVTLIDESFLGKEAQVLLIEIDRKCIFFDSVLASTTGMLGQLCTRLESSHSHVVLSMDEALIEDADVQEKLSDLHAYRVSHFQYLLTAHFPDCAESVETRLCDALGLDRTAPPAERQKHYTRVADYLRQGKSAFETFLQQLQAAASLAPEARSELFHTVTPESVFHDSETHRTAVYIATHFPELNQRDFDSFMRVLLGNTTVPKERLREKLRADGKWFRVREEQDELCIDQWNREGDRVFRDCHLLTVSSTKGSRVVDFSEPYLRDELRAYLERQSPWYLRRQSQRLQGSRILFDPEISPAAVDGLVRLFVERAIVDPAGFGSIRLLDLLRGLHGTISDGLSLESPEEALAWLSTKLARPDHRSLLTDRLAALIREILDHDSLRPVFNQFFEHLIDIREHDALLDLILDLTPRLRFAPHFHPVSWLRRLLDKSTDEEVQLRTIDQLLDLARRSGPNIYEFLKTIRGWLPDEDQLRSDWPESNRLAIEFLFYYSAEMARWIQPGVWPSQHPLFYALPKEPGEARETIRFVVNWILDERISTTEAADPLNPNHTADSIRMNCVADLLEHWAWVLEGPTERGPAEGRALFQMILDELNQRINSRQRSMLQRCWQRRQDEQLAEAAKRPDRKHLITRKGKLEHLRMRLIRLSAPAETRMEGELRS